MFWMQFNLGLLNCQLKIPVWLFKTASSTCFFAAAVVLSPGSGTAFPWLQVPPPFPPPNVSALSWAHLIMGSTQPIVLAGVLAFSSVQLDVASLKILASWAPKKKTKRFQRRQRNCIKKNENKQKAGGRQRSIQVS